MDWTAAGCGALYLSCVRASVGQARLLRRTLSEAGLDAALVIVLRNASLNVEPAGGAIRPGRAEISRMMADFFDRGLKQRNNIMTGRQLTLDDIIQMTLEVGDDWAVAHARRLLELIRQIGAGLPHDFQILELAAYLHDWGAFPAYIQKGVEHALRSRQVVAEEIVPCLVLTPTQKSVLLEAIELHDYRDQRPTQSNEALLLREADMLEFLGMIGMAREFARGPRNVEICYQRILSRRYGIQGRFTLPRAVEIARLRLERMETGLQWLNEESFGIL